VRQIVATILPRMSQAVLNQHVAGELLTQLAPVRSSAAPELIELAAARVYSTTEQLFAQRPALVEYRSLGPESSDTGMQGFRQSVPGLGSMYVMFTVLGGISSLQRERQRWTLPRLAAMPLRRWQILGGKILTYFVLGMLQYLIVFAAGWFVGLDFGPRPELLWLVMAAFVLCCTALALALAPMMSNPGQAGLIAQLLSLSFAALGGAWWPLEIVSPWMRMVGHLSPIAWAMDGFQDLLFYRGDLWAILPEVGILGAIALLCFGVGIWRFRYL
jgi:ABC-2 type transport system permease protein